VNSDAMRFAMTRSSWPIMVDRMHLRSECNADQDMRCKKEGRIRLVTMHMVHNACVHLPNGYTVTCAHLPIAYKVTCAHLSNGYKLTSAHLPNGYTVACAHLPNAYKVQPHKSAACGVLRMHSLDKAAEPRFNGVCDLHASFV